MAATAKRNRSATVANCTEVTVADDSTVPKSSKIPHRVTRIPVTELNPHLTCALCSGYFVDATTIVECLHSFCRACLLSYLETSDNCPICDAQINENQLHKNIRSDHTLQDLVYKLIPGLYKSELERRKEFCLAQVKHTKNEPGISSSAPLAEKLFEIFDKRLVDLASSVCTPDEIVSFSMEFYYRPPPAQPVKRGRRKLVTNIPMKSPSELTPSSLKDLSYKRYFRCPAAVKMTHLKKLISLKLDLSNNYKIDIWHLANGESSSEELISDDWSLRDIAFVYSWNRKAPLRLHFNICKYEIEEEPMPKLVKEEISIEESESDNPSPEYSTEECFSSKTRNGDSSKFNETYKDIFGNILAHEPPDCSGLLAIASAIEIKHAENNKFNEEIYCDNLTLPSLPEREISPPEISPTAVDRCISQPPKLRFKKSLNSVVQQLATTNGIFPNQISTNQSIDVPEDPNHVNGRFAGEIYFSNKIDTSDNRNKECKRENVDTVINLCTKNKSPPPKLDLFGSPNLNINLNMNMNTISCVTKSLAKNISTGKNSTASVALNTDHNVCVHKTV